MEKNKHICSFCMIKIVISIILAISYQAIIIILYNYYYINIIISYQANIIIICSYYYKMYLNNHYTWRLFIFAEKQVRFQLLKSVV